MGFFGSKVETVGQIHFVEEMGDLLSSATDASTNIQQVVKNANSVVDRLQAVRAGELVVQPPLSHEQFTDFEERAKTVIAIGNKATNALDQTAKSRESTANQSGDSAKFDGPGSSKKS